MTRIAPRMHLDELVTRLRDRRRRAHALRFYRRFVPKGGLCFDIGANVGGRTSLFLELGAHVIAVEPQPGCAQALREAYSAAEVIEAAVGPEHGTANLFVASYHTLSSLSPDWIEAVRASGRFDEFDWNEQIEVDMVTLDELVDRAGVPDFCKIDVEGFELGVVSGLTRPLRTVSFEFDVEGREDRLRAVRHLDELGMGRFNFSFGETLTLALPEWVDADGICRFLEGPAHGVDTFGDVYAAA